MKNKGLESKCVTYKPRCTYLYISSLCITECSIKIILSRTIRFCFESQSLVSLDQQLRTLNLQVWLRGDPSSTNSQAGNQLMLCWPSALIHFFRTFTKLITELSN